MSGPSRGPVGGPFGRVFGSALWRPVERDHWQEDRAFRRRQLVTAGFALLGAAVLAFSLRLSPGSNAFIVSTLVLAGVWAVGAFASGPIHLGRVVPRTEDGLSPRPILEPIVVGFSLAAIFVLGALLIREVPFLGALERQITHVLDYADQGTGPTVLLTTVLNGIAEELFFRGAVWAALRRNQLLWTTIIYVVATAATGNLMLSFAAILVGVVVGLERRVTGGILAPAITHICWSVTMLYALPAIFF